MRGAMLVAVLGSACRREPAAVDAGPATPGSALLQGTWQVEGFEATSPAGSASAAALSAQLSSDSAQSVRIQYTGDQVRLFAPGQPPVSSGYQVKESRAGWVRILNGADEVEITFRDDDHAIIDRRTNVPRMKIRRASDLPPTAAGPAPTVTVVGTSSAGNPIIKIGP